MKKAFVLIASLLPFAVAAQDTKTVKKSISPNLVETYTISKATNTKEGLYMILDQGGNAIARGIYKNDKKDGIWSYFDQSTNVVQRYDYNNNKLVYYSPEPNSSIKSDYAVEAPAEAQVSPPVAIGGETLDFLALFNSKNVDENIEKRDNGYSVTYNIEVLPDGTPGDIYLQYSNTHGLTEKRKIHYATKASYLTFIPAKVNGQTVKSHLLITSFITTEDPKNPGSKGYYRAYGSLVTRPSVFMAATR